MRNYLYILIVVALISGCTGYQYVSTPVYVPTNYEQGSIKANISINSIQAGYSLSDHISVFANGYSRKSVKGLNTESMFGKENSGASIRSDSSYEANVGLSYYFVKWFLNFEVLLGTGIGELQYNNTLDFYPDNYVFNMNANKYNIFIQPYIAYRFRNLYECGLFTKLSYYSYYDIKSSGNIGINGESNKVDEFDDYFRNKKQVNLYFGEPGMFFRIGFRNVKFQTTVSNTISLNNEDYYYRDFNLRFSVFLDISTKK